MILESPIMQEALALSNARRMHRAIAGVLGKRFGQVPEDLRVQIQSVMDDDRLERLNQLAATCTDLDDFRRQLAAPAH